MRMERQVGARSVEFDFIPSAVGNQLRDLSRGVRGFPFHFNNTLVLLGNG